MSWSPKDLQLPSDEVGLRRTLRNSLRFRQRYERGTMGWASSFIVARECIRRIRLLVN